MSAALQVHDQALARLDQPVRFDTEHVVPRSGGSPHLVLLQQVGVDEHPQMRRVTKRRHATDVACTLSPMASAFARPQLIDESLILVV